ncbi:MAG: helix-turn-helix transcriptional regulator [Rhodobacteraceae bacterium]|nr:helix-turn-helix transcriptional regulator [Paracoccaceae bacterium]
MSYSIPLIRSAVVVPFLRWMKENGRPVQDHLEAVGLGFVSPDQKELPIPLFSVFALFRLMAKLEGPDIPARVITAHSLFDLGNFGQVILGSRSPRDALVRIVNVIPRYSTHEQVSLWPVPRGQSLRAGWSMLLDDEAMHLTQQFTAGLACALCKATGLPGAAPRSLRVRPHPVYGLEHLRERFGPALGVAHEAPAEIDFDDGILDLPLRFGAMAAPEAIPADWESLKGDGSFSHSARLVLNAMGTQDLTLQRLADLAGMSTRSLQRAFTKEGTQFRQLMDESRRDAAMVLLKTQTGRLDIVAAELGFAEQSALSRAVKRWTGENPKDFRHAQARELRTGLTRRR